MRLTGEKAPEFPSKRSEASVPIKGPARLVHTLFAMQPASVKWYDQRNRVFLEFCIEDSQDINIHFYKSKLKFSSFGNGERFKHLNDIDIFFVY